MQDIANVSKPVRAGQSERGNAVRTQINMSAEAGSVIRRVREDQGISRSELAKRAQVSPRTLFAFERGQNDNMGLAAFLRLAGALGLSVSMDFANGSARAEAASGVAPEEPQLEFHPSWEKLSDIWSLEEGER